MLIISCDYINSMSYQSKLKYISVCLRRFRNVSRRPFQSPALLDLPALPEKSHKRKQTGECPPSPLPPSPSALWAPIGGMLPPLAPPLPRPRLRLLRRLPADLLSSPLSAPVRLAVGAGTGELKVDLPICVVFYAFSHGQPKVTRQWLNGILSATFRGEVMLGSPFPRVWNRVWNGVWNRVWNAMACHRPPMTKICHPTFGAGPYDELFMRKIKPCQCKLSLCLGNLMYFKPA